LTATCGVVEGVEVAVCSGRVSVVDVMWWGAPVTGWVSSGTRGPLFAGDETVHAG